MKRPVLKTKLGRTLYRRGWSDADLAAATGLGRSRVNRIKNGRVVPTVGEALRIGRALSLSVAELFYLDGSRRYFRDG